MITHHPDTQLLNEFTAGTLNLAQSACVSLHLNYCEECRRQTQRLQQVGAAMFDRLPPQQIDASMLDSLMARLDEESRIGGAFSQGLKSGITGVVPPDAYPPDVWKELVRVGRLLDAGHKTLELPPE